MKYEEATEYIRVLGKKGSILGLDRMKSLCALLNNPQDRLKIIHIAGTNGKGSTSCYISNVLSMNGYSCGMYYSPSLTSIKDHYMVDGVLISDEEYALCVEAVKKANDRLLADSGDGATQFEVETALAFYYFEKKGCDFVVLETGLGGRDDATNIVSTKIMSVFTSISYDHMAILGNTLSEIAEVKSGIITSSHTVVALNSSYEVIEVIKNKCRQMQAKCRVVEPCSQEEASISSSNIISCGKYDSIEIASRASYQRDNAVLALAVIEELEELGYEMCEAGVRRGMLNAKWPFRFERITDEPLTYLDGAHNADAAIRLRQSIQTQFPDKELIMVIACFKDKEYDKVIAALAPLARRIISLTTPSVPERALDKDIIKAEADKYCDYVVAANNVKEAAALAKAYASQLGENSLVLACGSLSYLSDFKNEM